MSIVSDAEQTVSSIVLKLPSIWDSIRDYVTAALGALALISITGWYITDVRLHSAQAQVKTEKSGREEDRANYKAAQAEALAKAQADVKKKEDEFNAKAKTADASYHDLLSKYDASLMRYKATKSVPRTTPLSGSALPTGSVNGPGESSVVPSGQEDFIVIPYTDAQVCAENTARLEAAHEWSQSLDK